MSVLRPRLPSVHTRENLRYKRGYPKIGLDRRGGTNQNIPNPRLALRWPHPCSLPIEWGSRGCPRMSTFNHEWYLTPRSGCRQRTEMGEAAILAVALWLTPEESAWQRLWRGQRKHNRLLSKLGQRNQKEQTQSTPILTCGSGGSPGYGGWPLIKINSSHNNNWIEFISYDFNSNCKCLRFCLLNYKWLVIRSLVMLYIINIFLIKKWFYFKHLYWSNLNIF